MTASHADWSRPHPLASNTCIGNSDCDGDRQLKLSSSSKDHTEKGTCVRMHVPAALILADALSSVNAAFKHEAAHTLTHTHTLTHSCACYVRRVRVQRRNGKPRPRHNCLHTHTHSLSLSLSVITAAAAAAAAASVLSPLFRLISLMPDSRRRR